MAAVSRQVYLTLFCDAQIDIRAMRSGASPGEAGRGAVVQEVALNAMLGYNKGSRQRQRSQRAPGAAEDGADPHSAEAARASHRTALKANCRTVWFRSSPE